MNYYLSNYYTFKDNYIMKKKFTLTLLFFIVLIRYSYSQQVTFEYVYTSDNDKEIYSVIEGENNSIYFVGRYHKPASNKFNGYVSKLTSSGEFADSIHIIYPDNSSSINNIFTDSINRLILTGFSFDTHGYFNNYSIALFKLDTSLSILKQTHYHFPADYKLFVQTSRFGLDNNLLIIGTVKSPISYKMFFYKLNRDFDSLNAKIYIHDPGVFPYDIKELNNGNFWILRGLLPYYVLIDSNMNLISAEESFIPHLLNASYGIKWDTDSSFYLAADYFAGYSKKKTKLTLPNISNLEQYHLKDNRMTDHDMGFIRQHHPFDTAGYLFNSIGAKDTFDFPASWGALDFKNKDSIFMGSTKNVSWVDPLFGHQPSWFRLIQTDSMLNIRWEHFYYGDAYYFMMKLIATGDGGCIMAGTRFDYISHPNIHKRDIYILKVNSEGLITSTNGKPIDIVHNAIVFPNPGTDLLQVRVAAQYKQSLFRLFDMNGRLVLTQDVVGKSATVNTTFLPTGTYVYKITGNKGLYESGKWIKK